MSRHIAFALLLAVSLSQPVTAQLIEVQPGARVRIEAPGAVAGSYEGTVLARTADTLILGGPHVSPIRVPIAQITGLEISHGMSRERGAKIGMKWGVPITTALGASILTAIAADDSCPTCYPLKASEVVSGLALSALVGAIYGASIGAMIGKERWDRFELPRGAAIAVRRDPVAVTAPAATPPVFMGVGTRFGELQAGARVKVVAPGVVAGRSEATVIRTTPDTLWLSLSGAGPSAVPLRAITELEVSRGKNRLAGALRGAMYGAGIGVPLGLSGNTQSDDLSDTEFFFAQVAGGAMIGAAIGAYIGREHWEHFQIGAATSSREVRPSMRLGLSFSF